MTHAFLVPTHERLSLSKLDPADTAPYTASDDRRATSRFDADIARLVDLQARLHAEGRQALLVILQAMDTGGKDGVIRNVGGPLDSRGCYVASFKAPAGEELEHDYLWRAHARCPRRGELAFFNRSHYEDIVTARVFGLAPRTVWSRRYDHINAFERMLVDEGTTVVKIFLHISKEEQRRRLQERLDDPSKRWKFAPSDLEARGRWDELQRAYEEVFERCSTKEAPWYIVPSDHKWFRDLCVARLLVETLSAMKPRYPEPAQDISKVVIPP